MFYNGFIILPFVDMILLGYNFPIPVNEDNTQEANLPGVAQ